jgi:hypothetical protein
MTPPTTVDIQVEVNDSDILAIERGPWAYMRAQQEKRMNLEDFRRTVIDKFAMIGFEADVLAHTTNVPDVYAFEVVVKRRLGTIFDPDRQVHEVVGNLLDLPDQKEGWINTDAALAAAERQMRENPHRH